MGGQRRRTLGDRSPVHRLARGRLGPVAVVAQSVGAIAPTAAMVTTPALITAGAGPGAVWSALVGSLAVLLVASAITVFARRLAAPGSLYAFVAQGLGPARAFAAGCALLVGYACVSVASFGGSALYLASLARTLGLPSGAGLQVAVMLGLAAAVGALVLRGVRTASVVLVGLEVLAVAVIVAVVAQLLALPVPQLPVADLAPARLDVSAVAAGVVTAVVAFIGFESSTALAPEVRRPLSVIPRALAWTVGGTSVLFVVGTYAVVGAFSRTGVDPAASVTPINDLVVASGIAMPAALLDLAAATSFIACTLASTTALVRLLFAMGTERMAPAALGATHPRFRTPHVALAVSLPLLAALAVLPVALGAPVRWLMDTAVSVSVLGYVLCYVFVCVAVGPFLSRIGERTAGPVVRAVVAALVLGTTFVVFAVRAAVTDPVVPVVFAAAMAVGAGWYWRKRAREPRDTERIGVFDQTSTDDVLWRLPERPDRTADPDAA